MATSDSAADLFAASLHRALLGVLLVVVAAVGIGMMTYGGLLNALAGGVLAVAAAALVLALFWQGLREGRGAD